MTRELPDHYAALGVASTASPTEITRAYRRRIRNQHPDTRPDTGPGTGAEALGDVIAAYAALRDPARRAEYDLQRQSTTNTNNPPLTPCRPPSPAPLLRVGPVRYHGPPHRGHQ